MFLSKPSNERVREFWLNFVKIILLKSDNCALALRKRLFCDAKPTLLPCKTAAFGTQNNRFYNALINNKLHGSYACEKYLHYCSLLFAYKIHLIPNTSIQKRAVLFVTALDELAKEGCSFAQCLSNYFVSLLC